MVMKAILIGSIGALTETSEIQRQCFNQALAEHETGLYWNVANYCEMIRTPGGLARLVNLGIDATTAQAIHQRKQALYQAAIQGQVKARDGIVALIDECHKQKIALGFITTTTTQTLSAVMKALSHEIDFTKFALITDMNAVSKAKPHADIYRFALERLALEAKDVVAIEDSEANVGAAQKAGIQCYFTPGEYAYAPDEAQKTRPLSYAHCNALLQQAA